MTTRLENLAAKHINEKGTGCGCLYCARILFTAGFKAARDMAALVPREMRLPELADPDTWTHNAVCDDIEASIKALGDEDCSNE